MNIPPEVPRVIFGTANFGSPPSNGKVIGPLRTEEAQGFLNVLKDFKVSVIDTARSYVCSYSLVLAD